MTAVVTHTRLVDALRTLVTLADRHEPEWAAAAALADYRAAVLEGRVALLEAEPSDEPVGNVVALPVAQPHAHLIAV
jgi:hypothetical protein